MTKYFLVTVLLLSICAASLFAQSIRIINLKTARQIDSIRSNTHFNIVKLSDSAWRATEYDMDDSIMDVGTYKDEQLLIKDGKFKVYNYEAPIKQIKYDYVLHKGDTVIVPPKNYLQIVCYFLNNKRAGPLYEYDLAGKLSLTEVFENDKLNGLYKKYDTETGKVLVQGNYVDDLREGNWDELSFNGDVIATDIYKKGKYIKTISHLNEKKFKQKQVGGIPQYNVIAYLNRILAEKRVDVPAGTKTVFYSITEDVDGKLIEPDVIGGGDLAIDTVIIDALLAAPKWPPCYINGQLTKMSTSFRFEVTITDDKYIHIAEAP